MSNYILSIDQGTTATKVALYTIDGELKALSTHPIKQLYPKKGWVEHDPCDLLNSIIQGIEGIISKSGISKSDIVAVAIDNQGETVIPFNKSTGEPLYNAIVWQDNRTALECREIKNKITEETITEKTGLFLDPYFSATKLKWLIDNVDPVQKALKKGNVVLSTSDVWLIYMLTGGKAIFTDVTTASRTMLFNINSIRWDDDLLSLFEIPTSALPDIVPSVYDFGVTDPVNCAGISAPIYASLVDQQAALFGHTCFYSGEAKITYGTGGFFLINIGENRLKLRDKIITTIAAQHSDNIQYAIDGGTYCVGSCIDWIVKRLKIVPNPEMTGEIAYAIKDNGGVYFIPGLSGLSVPHWEPGVRGAFMGLTLNTSAEHVVRSVLEGIAYRFLEILNIIKVNGFQDITSVSVDGGVSRNDFLMQFQADLFGIAVRRPTIREITSLGGAYLAGLKIGVWENIKCLKNRMEIDKIFYPEKNNSKKLEQFEVWRSALESIVSWHRCLDSSKA